MTDRADGPVERPVLGDLAAEQLAPQVLTHARRVPAREDQTVELVGPDVAHESGALNSSSTVISA